MKQKTTGTLERTPSRSSTGSGTPKMGSLERKSSSPKMNSLERNAQLISSSHSSLDKTGMFSPKLGSLERKSHGGSPNSPGTFSPKMGSLERNAHIIYSDRVPNYHAEPTMYTVYPSDKVQYFEESIYDFGGADVKSCAHKAPYFAQKATVVQPQLAEREIRTQVRSISSMAFGFPRVGCSISVLH